MSRFAQLIASVTVAIAILVPLSPDEARARTRCFRPDAHGRRHCVRDHRPRYPQEPAAYYPEPAPEPETPRGLHPVPPTGFR